MRTPLTPILAAFLAELRGDCCPALHSTKCCYAYAATPTHRAEVRLRVGLGWALGQQDATRGFL